MNVIKCILLLLVCPLLTSLAVGQETLPRVLILGDSIYNEPSRSVTSELKGIAEVVYVPMQPGEVRNTSAALANLERLLGERKWDLIFFNFGLGDLVYRAPGMNSFRVLPKEVGGVRATTPEQYEKNLHQLVERLQATGTKLVWASTTPIRHSSTNIFDLGSEVEYNAIAAQVMAEHGVPINDMYSYAITLIDMTKPASHGVDPFFFDRKPLHGPIVATITKTLSLAPQSPGK